MMVLNRKSWQQCGQQRECCNAQGIQVISSRHLSSCPSDKVIDKIAHEILLITYLAMPWNIPLVEGHVKATHICWFDGIDLLWWAFGFLLWWAFGFLLGFSLAFLLGPQTNISFQTRKSCLQSGCPSLHISESYSFSF